MIRRTLRHLELPTDVPEPRPARAPPRHLDFTTIRRKTPLLSTPPDEGTASHWEGLALDADTRARSCFPLPLGDELPQNRARTTGLSALSKGEGAERFGRLDLITGQVVEFQQRISVNAAPIGIVVGPDGNIWFSEGTLDRSGRIARLVLF